VISFIAGRDEPDSDKKTLLRQAAREIGRNKYAKFYRPRTGEMDPAFAAYVYEIYKIMRPASVFAGDAAMAGRLRQLSAEAFMGTEAQELLRKLRPEAVQERARQLEPRELSRELKEDLASLHGAFDGARAAAINRCYRLVAALTRFAQFDFLSLLRRFDADLPSDHLADYAPRFQAAKAADLAKELGQFRALIQDLEPSDDWKIALGVLKTAHGGQELFPPTQWNTLLANLRDLKNSGIIELIARHAAGDPDWQAQYEAADEGLAETFLEAKGAEIQAAIDGALARERDSRIESLSADVFGAPALTKLSFYNREISGAIAELGFSGFAYAQALNYLMAFIQDFVDREMRDLCDLLLVRGQWTNNPLSLEMSSAVHDVTDLGPKIEALDQTLSETGIYGIRFRNVLSRSDRDKGRARYINSVVEELDGAALGLINAAVQALAVAGKHVKNLVADSQKGLPEMIINWKELGRYTKPPMTPRLAEAYRKINCFMQLMLLYTRPDGT
jgi:hypothetical protein